MFISILRFKVDHVRMVVVTDSLPWPLRSHNKTESHSVVHSFVVLTADKYVPITFSVNTGAVVEVT